jgi:hypothetical protein
MARPRSPRSPEGVVRVPLSRQVRGELVGDAPGVAEQANYTPGSGGAVTTWERDWKLLTGWKRWLVVAGAVHASFTDLALLADQTGLDIGAGLPGARSLDITRAYVRAFFDQHLRSRPQALLDQPSPRYPEVTFCSP